MHALLCCHIKSNGVTCGSVALCGADFCHQHYHFLKRRRKLTAAPREFPATSSAVHMDLARVEDPRSLQIALNQILQGLVTGRLTNKRGSTILHGLHLASTNLTRMSARPPKLLVRNRNPSS